MNLTQDQVKRKELYYHVMRFMMQAGVSTDKQELVWRGAPVWAHFTDFQLADVDPVKLIDAGLIGFHPYLKYESDGTWQDRFPPTAYVMTDKARAMLLNVRLWIISGELDNEALERWKDDRLKRAIQENFSTPPSGT